MYMFKQEKAFTLVEMLIVLLIISVLILLIVPNLTNKSKNIHQKGCSALVSLVESQVVSFKLDRGRLPNDLTELVEEKYIKSEQLVCENNKIIVMNETGEVSYE